MLELAMRSVLPYILITVLFFASLLFWHKDVLNYKFDPILVNNYLRSQDIEDRDDKIEDRIFVSDSDIYIASGYLYVKGESPTKYNFQHPPLIKYLYGLSALLFANPFYVQMFFGLVLLYLTYFLGSKLFKGVLVPTLATGLLLADPVFQGMQAEALLDLGQATLALFYLILAFFYPRKYILIGIVLGFLAASKFWSTAIILVVLVLLYKVVLGKERLNLKKTAFSLVVAILIFSLTYLPAFVKEGQAFNILSLLVRDLRFMLSHNSASRIGGPIILFMSGFFAPWWQSGVVRSDVWSFLWPLGMVASLLLAIKTKIKEKHFFFYLLPIVYILLTSTQVPFTRYFILILPLVYLSLSNFVVGLLRK